MSSSEEEKYKILIVDDTLTSFYVGGIGAMMDHDQSELEKELNRKYPGNTFEISTFIGKDFFTFHKEFVNVDDIARNTFYENNIDEFQEIDIFIIDAKFKGAGPTDDKSDKWGDIIALFLNSKLLHSKIIKVSQYYDDDRVLMTDSNAMVNLSEKIVETLRKNGHNIENAYTQNKREGYKAVINFDDKWSDSKKFLEKNWLKATDFLRFSIHLGFFVIFLLLGYKTISSTVKTFKIGHHHVTVEYRKDSANISNFISDLELLIPNRRVLDSILLSDGLVLDSYSAEDSSRNEFKRDSVKIAYNYVNQVLLKLKKQHNINETTDEFEFIENIFIYFIPGFLVAGFYIYFMKNLQRHLRGSEVTEEEDKSSQRSMDLTKKLFLASIFSFTLLKIVDISLNEIDYYTTPVIPNYLLLKLSALLCVLLMIIVYSFSQRHSH